MYLIDFSYFIGKYEIADIDESHAGVAYTVEIFIDTEIRLFMQGLLGNELFKEFDSYVTDGVLDPGAPQKWLDLVKGTEYDGKKWNGLIYTIGDYPKSLFTNYIWAKYFVEKNRIDGNGNSNVIISKNAARGNAGNQYYAIWNEFVAMTVITNDEYVSLNQFLTDKNSDYPTTNFVQVEYENRFL